MPNITDIKKYFCKLQSDIIESFESFDSCSFKEDLWNYSQGEGGGKSCVLENGTVFEKAAVNFSHIKADKLPESILSMRPELHGYSFQALGVSVIAHPLNPFVPTSHANVRFFIAEKDGCEPKWWFGGGFDLTPYYGFENDCIHWHKTALDACILYGDDLYSDFKKQCDNYFYLPHRDEHRGIGGLFFDNFCNKGFKDSFLFVKSIGEAYIKAYTLIVERRKDTVYNKSQRDFQLYRRGRYVEFNLLLDKGTHFGLQSKGRTESILVSMPPLVAWIYNYKPIKNSAEDRLNKDFLTPKDWLNIN